MRECQIFDAGVSDTSFDRDCEARIQVPRKGSKKIPKPSRRTRIVWVSFLGSMAAVIGLLALGDRRPGPGFPAAHASLLADSPAGDRIFQTDIPLGPNRWKAIVIHHSGEPGGDPESIRRQHLSYGARAMGYHFLVGNGNGMGDGVVHVGERWITQAPGWHSVGPDADYYNQNAIGICLVGNGDRRRFTDRQITQLISLVRRLQRQLDLPPSAVRLHRDVAPA
ncbi:MAG: peptidoglycan recognition protein family protein [Planctomycetota bacterium]